MRPEPRRQVTRLFVALEYGEQLAQRCALHQSTLVTDTRARRFLRAQARQERVHALLFHQAAGWLAPKHRLAVPRGLERFAWHLDQAMRRNDFTECLVGSQLVLEGFGEQILMRLNRGLDHHNIGFSRQRRLILRQEQSHSTFGLRTLQGLLFDDPGRIEHIATYVDQYVHLAQDITHDMAEVFDVLDEDPDEYIMGMTDNLTDCLDGLGT